MKKILFTLMMICFSYGSLFAHRLLAMEEAIVNNTDDTWSVVNIAGSTLTTFTYQNNSIPSVNEAWGTYDPETPNQNISWQVGAPMYALKGASVFYVATNGNDSYPGTIAQPWLTWQKGFETLTAGQTLYIRGGTYTVMKGEYNGNWYGVRVGYHDGTEAEPITVSAYPGETPILDCVGLVSANGSHDGILLDGCSYWDVTGLTVINVSEDTNHNQYETANGISLGDCDHITLRQCTSRNNGGGFAGGGDYVYFINCDAYENNDVYDNGGYANGFSCNVNLGDHVFFTGCRAWLNSDDGYDLYGGDQIAVFENCWAFENGYWNGYTGNGEGFKTGRVYNQSSGVVRTLINCLSFDNLGYGFDESQDHVYTSSVTHVIYNNTSCRNSQGFTFAYSGAYTDTIKNNISFDESPGNFGSNYVQYNSWQNGHSVTAADFVSVNSEGVKGARQSDGSLPDLNFLHLATGSDLIDAGIDVDLPYNASAPDLGANEFTGINNHYPTIIDQSFQVDENSPNGTEAGTVVASDPDAGQTLEYSIVSGNTDGAFTINASTGELTVTNSAAVIADFILVAQVQDNGTDNLSSQATITINVIPMGIESTGNNSTIKVYPNPVSDELIIEIKGNNDRQGFEILNSMGHIVYKGYLSEKTVVTTTNFSPGVYFIKLQNGKIFKFEKK